MAETEFHPIVPPGRGAWFEETNWWVVREAGQPGLPQADAARASLCQTYWYPIYCYVRRMGQGHEDAQDLTQAFFARLLEKNYVQAAAAEKGKFRSYLLMMLKRFLADQSDRAQRQKRGGGMAFIALDTEDTEFRYRQEPADELSPDKLFDRAWARSLLRRALERLEQEWRAAGKTASFQELKPHITCESDRSCAAVAQKLGMTVNHLKITVHRLRQRYGELLRQEIARTAATAEAVEEELRDLHAALN